MSESKSEILARNPTAARLMAQAGKKLDAAPVPTKNRQFYNSKTNKAELLPAVTSKEKAAAMAKAHLANQRTPNLAEIVALAQRQLDLERMVADVTASLADITAELRKVAEEDLPEAMSEAGVDKVTLADGSTVEIKRDFSVGIPAERKDEAFNWLEAKGFGGLVKTEVKVSFGKGEFERAQKLAATLAGKKFLVEVGRNVHWQSLKAWVKEQAERATAYPSDLFGAHPLNKAIVKVKK